MKEVDSSLPQQFKHQTVRNPLNVSITPANGIYGALRSHRIFLTIFFISLAPAR